VNGRAYQNLARGPMVRALLALATGGLLGSAIFAVAGNPGGPEPPPAGPVAAARQPEFAKLYDANCRSCHGRDGCGKDMREAVPTMPDFTSAAWQQGQSDKAIAGRIAEGSDPLMPAFREKLTKDEIEALTAHLRSFAAPAKKAPEAARRSTAPALPHFSRPAVAASTAEQLYKDGGCVNCHDKDGRGGVVRKAMPEIPDFTDAKWHKDNADDDTLAKSILEGKGKFMMAQKDKLSKDDVKQLVAHVRKFKDAKPADAAKEPPKAEPDPAAGEMTAALRAGSAIFQEKCLGCHGKDGRGGAAGAALANLPDFSSRAWQASRSDAQLSVSILEGKGTQMPPFRDRLKAEQTKALVAHIRTLGPAPSQPDQKTKTSDFEEEFRRLEQEWEALKKQQDELMKKAGKQ
jgi:mono/diheme cytochrome c family protein